jgi:hypothetical protein
MGEEPVRIGHYGQPVRAILVLTALAAAVAVLSLSATAAPRQGGFGSPACLRGEWHASQAETRRVMRALVPVDGLEPRGRLYMIFRDGAFQYGSTDMLVKIDGGDLVMTAQARFFTLQRYTARPGALTTQRGTSTIEYGRMTATKRGQTYSVAGPPPKTTRIPGGTTPFQCRDNTLKVRMPRFASLNWITLARG